MKSGKHICETLKGIRADIARANDIDYTPTECTHQGDCAGTCPACESEVHWLEHQLKLRQRLGLAVTIAGISLGTGTIAAQNQSQASHPNQPIERTDSAKYEIFGDVPSNLSPSFRGGEKALMDYLAEHIVLPDSIEHPTGKIVAQLTIERDGTVSDVEIVRDPIQNPAINAIIIDVLKHLPRFRPAMQGGKRVATQYMVPIIFTPKNKDNDADD
ncbi:MAG: energy transducer TonB [Muribaculaceae bacterium]|nr:energy transducer TonB [Muribaculaceae bacterium]